MEIGESPEVRLVHEVGGGEEISCRWEMQEEVADGGFIGSISGSGLFCRGLQKDSCRGCAISFASEDVLFLV